jgi:bifunctional aspartokinase / homoserine dehydrogenase 1
MSEIVMKFGGTSVGSAESIRQSAAIVQRWVHEHRVVVIVSALSGVTDLILKAVDAAHQAQQAEMLASIDELEARHNDVLNALFDGAERTRVEALIHPVLRQLRDFCSALLMLRSITPQLLDVVLPIGERMSAHIFAAALNGLGIDGTFMDSSKVLVTDDRFGDAAADMDATAAKCTQELRPLLDAGTVPVVMGYSGNTQDGRSTTLGRGGSDSSATIIGAALKCDEVWIWTDVDGIMTADPRICPDAAILREVTFAEAIELSYYGAKVVHHKAIRPAMEAGIPVWIKNSFRPEVPGTRIQAETSSSDSAVKALTAVTPATLVSLTTRRDTYFAEIFGRFLLRLAHEHVEILFSTQSSSENSLGLVFRAADAERVFGAICKLFRMELKHGVLKPVVMRSDIAVVAVLGESMKGMSGIIGRLFSAVATTGESVIAVAQGASEINICFAVKSTGVAKVLRAVHSEFLTRSTFKPSAGSH